MSRATAAEPAFVYQPDVAVVEKQGLAPWKVLVVDDDADVHAATQFALHGLTLLDRPVQLVSARSAHDAQAMFLTESDIALALVDIVMESENAGLDLVRWVRHAHGNTKTRIVMRTGQAANLPEDTVVKEYEIDDFREKSEMTSQKLRTLVLSKLRAYNDLCTIDAQRQALQLAVDDRTRQLVSAQEKLMQSDKLASIGQLAAGVAHEINNPIGYVFSNFGTLESYLQDLYAVLDAYGALEPLCAGSQALQTVQKCKTEVDVNFVREDIAALMQESAEGIERVRQIVQDLKDFSRTDAADQWVFADLNRGISSTLNVVNNELKYRADVECVFGVLPEVQCLPSQINQVVLNLLVNAAQAMGEARGHIRVETGTAVDQVWIRVCDNGGGIAPEVLPRIFDPFFTTKPVGKGTGLGLSLSYGIVQKHHGAIHAESTLGVGSTFTVYLPVVQGNGAVTNATESCA